MDYEEKYELGSTVTARRTYNREIITGEFGGFHLLDKSNPKSIVGVVHTSNGSYDVEPNSIESVISEDERIRKDLIKYLNTDMNENPSQSDSFYNKCIAWLEKQGDIDKASYDLAEKEKREFVGDGFIKCYADFQDFKEGETYWMEYLGNDNYNVRSDNLLGKTYHITPCQLYTIFKKQTWLEKQGSQNPTDKVEPKFKVGDWAVNQHGYTRQIIDIKNDCYYCIKTESSDSIENPWYGTINYVDEQWHKWTIQDAKKGDILQVNKCTLILDSLTKDMAGNTVISSWYYCNTETFHCMGTSQPDLWATEGVVPATKEQRDILFQKMKESGYMWDVEKKELKKISQEYPLTPVEIL